MPSQERVPETEFGAAFPTAGIEATCEFGRQPPDTAADGVNVRSYDPVSSRNRGGSRTGLSRYIDELVIDASQVQHLAVLVDPQAALLSRDFGGDYPDPSTNNNFPRVPAGRLVRRGGSGINPRGNDELIGEVDGGEEVYRLVSKRIYNDVRNGGMEEFSGSARFIDSPSAVPVGGLLVVIVATICESDGLVITVRNTAGTDYPQSGSYQRIPADTGGDPTAVAYGMSCWVKRASGLPSNETSVRVDPGGVPCFMTVFIGVYSGGTSPFPIDGSSGSAVVGSIPPSFSTGIPTVGGDRELVVAGFSGLFVGTMSPSSPLTQVDYFSSGAPPLLVAHNTNVSSPSSLNPTSTQPADSAAVRGILGVSASVKG